MARKQIRVSRRMLFTWLMLAGLICLLAPQKLTDRFQLAFARIFRWPLSISRNISLSARMRQPLKNVVSRREYSRLQNHLANVTEELLQKHKKVEKLSGLRDRLYALEGAKLLYADVIIASGGLQSELMINRGENDKLALGQFVLGDNSIVGTVSSLSPRTAQVRLVTDSTSKIPVRIAELNVDRIMQGTGRNSARIQLLPIKHKVKIGDLVYAHKKPGFLDTPMVIGKVVQCKRDDENPSLWDITVEPDCNIERLSSVAVIIMNPQ